MLMPPPHKPMTLPASLEKVLTALVQAGGTPRIVGGAVRDHLLGLQPKDIDVEVFNLDESALAGALGQFKVDAVGKAFGVYKVSVDGETHDVSLPRTENKAGQGHRGFVVTPDPKMSFKDAAARRDFTINAIGYNPVTQQFEDPWNGREDLSRMILRAVSPAFEEDPLRVLRACQFAARFEFAIAADTADRCRKLRPELSTLPVERIREEWKKLLLKSRRPSIGLNALAQTEALYLFPELEALRWVPQEWEWHSEGHSMRFLGGAPKGLEEAVVHFCLSERFLSRYGWDPQTSVFDGIAGTLHDTRLVEFSRETLLKETAELQEGSLVGNLTFKVPPASAHYTAGRWQLEVGDVWVHNCMVVDAAVRVCRDDGLMGPDEAEEERLITILGALCHDLGKPATTKFDDGRWRAHAHETAGEEPTRSFLARLGYMPDSSTTEAVVALVKDHLKPFHLFRDKASNAAIRRLAVRVPLERLCRVARADFLGRATPDALAVRDSREIEGIKWLLAKAAELQVDKSGPAPILLGRHLIARGVKPGPEMGKILKAAFEAQLDGAFLDEAGGLSWLASHLPTVG